MPERVKIKFDDDGAEPVTSERPVKRQRVEEPLGSRLKPKVPSVRNDKKRSYEVPKKAVHQEQKFQPSRLRDCAANLLKQRRHLPIWAHADALRLSLREKNVLLLVGETGSGKSTQVAQFLVDEQWAKRQSGVGGCIAITEPRKVAAVSLARRVAEEVGTPLGSSSPASTVGYHVRFDRSISKNTKIKFLTEGMLLQEMLRDPWLRQYSLVVVDEVHERNVNVDLILGFVRNILLHGREKRNGLPLRIVVMSATADLEGLTRFFADGFRALKITKDSTCALDTGDNAANASTDSVDSVTEEISICHVKGRQFPVKVLYSPSAVDDIIEASLRIIFKINYGEPLPGDILVFLPGREAVESLQKAVETWAIGLKKDVPKLLALPLFASLTQTAQQRVFEPAPSRTRKVIIATNIAETSVTVSGVRHVIDCGKSKLKQYRSQIGLESLLCKNISQDAATQRKGRAGREAAGYCYRLYTETAYSGLEKATTPEILRCDLAQAILTMKAQGIEKPWQFPLLDTPSLKALGKGMEQLYQLQALDDKSSITELGRKIAKLPLSPPLGRILLAASAPDTDCVAEIIDIISCLSVEAVFLQPSSEGREKAAVSRSGLVRREGDHLTILAAMQAYTAEQSDRKAWCEQHLVSHRAMRGAWNIRKQLRSQATSNEWNVNFDPSSSNQPSPAVETEERASAVLKCLLTGLTMKTALLASDGVYKTCEGRHEISIHPSSVLFGKKVEAIVYGEHVYTNQSWARNVSAVQAQWIAEALTATRSS